MAEELKDLMFPQGKPEPEQFIIALTELAKQISNSIFCSCYYLSSYQHLLSCFKMLILEIKG